jgi:hypothetical protein
VAEIAGQKVFVLKMIQGRDPRWAEKIFFAEFDPKATWIEQLRPAFGERQFFFNEGMEILSADVSHRLWDDQPTFRTPLVQFGEPS